MNALQRRASKTVGLSLALACAASGLGVSTSASAGQPPQASLSSPKPQRFEVVADGHPLSVWMKRPASPRGSILLVHGRTWGALPNFDLQVIGQPRSVMDALVRRGYTAYALDQRGHGATPRDATGWLTPKRAADDVGAVLNWMVGREGVGMPRPVLLGYSMGSGTSLFAAQRHPNSLSMLVLYAFTQDLDALLGRGQTPAPTQSTEPARQPTTRAMAASDFITPGATSQTVVEAYVDQALKSDPVRVDWKDVIEHRSMDPSAVRVPTLVIHGAADPGTTPAKDMALLSRLGTTDRSLVVLPNSDHAAHVEDSQDAWVDAIVSFIERPRPQR